MLKKIGTIVLLICGLSPRVNAQVQIVVLGRQFKALERIPAKIVNSGEQPVTYCVEYGQSSPKAIGESESTPIPFYVQRKWKDKWGPLLIGPDVGSARVAEVLRPGQAHDYPFRLIATGQMRLVLEYWSIDDNTIRCSDPPKHPRKVTSSVFTVQ